MRIQSSWNQIYHNAWCRIIRTESTTHTQVKHWVSKKRQTISIFQCIFWQTSDCHWLSIWLALNGLIKDVSQLVIAIIEPNGFRHSCYVCSHEKQLNKKSWLVPSGTRVEQQDCIQQHITTCYIKAKTDYTGTQQTIKNETGASGNINKHFLENHILIVEWHEWWSIQPARHLQIWCLSR